MPKELSEISRKRLEWMANAKPGDTMPIDLFGAESWAIAVSESIKEALDVIDQKNTLTDQ